MIIQILFCYLFPFYSNIFSIGRSIVDCNRSFFSRKRHWIRVLIRLLWKYWKWYASSDLTVIKVHNFKSAINHIALAAGQIKTAQTSSLRNSKDSGLHNWVKYHIELNFYVVTAILALQCSLRPGHSSQWWFTVNKNSWFENQIWISQYTNALISMFAINFSVTNPLFSTILYLS